ncbi:MAG: hypothetical protein ACI8Y7_000595 [Candidatus Woesearchaeota archaeon]|jgi:hypothetical protein
MAEFIYIAPLIMGVIIGLVEMFFLSKDEAGLHWLGHGLHALPVCIIFTFLAMNVPWVVGAINQPWLSGALGTYIIPIIIGIVAAVKVKTAAAIARGGSVGETWIHALIIGLLIAASPWIWSLALVKVVPAWMAK